MRSMRYILVPALSLCLAGPALAQMTQGTTTVGPSTGTMSGEGYGHGPASRTYPVIPGRYVYPPAPVRSVYPPDVPPPPPALSLTSRQIDRLNAALTPLEASYTDQIDRLSRLSWADRVRLLRELRRHMSSDWLRIASQILTPAQLEHYARHAMEVRDLEGYSDAELLKKLHLTSQQLQQLQSVRAQADRETGRIRILAREDLREADRRHLEYRQRWYEAANNALSGDQERFWRDLPGNANFNYRPNLTSPERR